MRRISTKLVNFDAFTLLACSTVGQLVLDCAVIPAHELTVQHFYENELSENIDASSLTSTTVCITFEHDSTEIIFRYIRDKNKVVIQISSSITNESISISVTLLNSRGMRDYLDGAIFHLIAKLRPYKLEVIPIRGTRAMSELETCYLPCGYTRGADIDQSKDRLHLLRSLLGQTVNGLVRIVTVDDAEDIVMDPTSNTRR